jgi:hypothetical protein
MLRKTLTDHFDKEWIRVSKLSAKAFVFFVEKPGDSLRFYMNYQKFHEIIKKNRTLLPLIIETLRIMAKAEWYTKLDVFVVFHKIQIKKENKRKTAFRTRFGFFKWLVTFFGLTGALAIFQRYINNVLRKLLGDLVFAYINDIIVFTNGFLQNYRNQILRIMKKLKDAGLQLNIDKCEFEQKKVKYLGYIINSEKGICVDSEKVEAIRTWEPPFIVKRVREFLGFANYYRKFILRFLSIAKPLTDLTKKDVPF